MDPRSLVPESIMPAYAFLATARLDVTRMSAHLVANRRVGVPYTDEMVANAAADTLAQLDPDGDSSALQQRYPKTTVRRFGLTSGPPTEMDALVAYLQMLGTLAEFDWRQPDPAMLR